MVDGAGADAVAVGGVAEGAVTGVAGAGAGVGADETVVPATEGGCVMMDAVPPDESPVDAPPILEGAHPILEGAPPKTVEGIPPPIIGGGEAAGALNSDTPPILRVGSMGKGNGDCGVGRRRNGKDHVTMV